MINFRDNQCSYWQTRAFFLGGFNHLPQLLGMCRFVHNFVDNQLMFDIVFGNYKLMRTKTFPCMSAQESQICMHIPKLCSLQGWKTTQLTLEDSSARSSNGRACARAGDSISWSRKRTLRRLRGKGKNCDFLLNLYTHVDIFTYVNMQIELRLIMFVWGGMK